MNFQMPLRLSVFLMSAIVGCNQNGAQGELLEDGCSQEQINDCTDALAKFKYQYVDCSPQSCRDDRPDAVTCFAKTDDGATPSYACVGDTCYLYCLN